MEEVEPPKSPVFDGNNLFKESPVEKDDKLENVSEVPTFDGHENVSSK